MAGDPLDRSNGFSNPCSWDRSIYYPMYYSWRQSGRSLKTSRFLLPSETWTKLSVRPSTRASIHKIDKAITRFPENTAKTLVSRHGKTERYSRLIEMKCPRALTCLVHCSPHIVAFEDPPNLDKLVQLSHPRCGYPVFWPANILSRVHARDPPGASVQIRAFRHAPSRLVTSAEGSGRDRVETFRGCLLWCLVTEPQMKVVLLKICW